MKILLHYRHFPVAMGRYFDFALRDLGHEVFSVGNYSGGKIPWGDQFDFPQYAFPPDLQIPEQESYPIDQVLSQTDFKPDLVLQAGDVTWLSGKAPCVNAILMTDPHCVDYTSRFVNADIIFNMQEHYRKPGQIWIPYAYHPPIHRVLPNVEKKYDVVLSGLQYDHRKITMEKIADRGLSTFNILGAIYEEYVQLYNESIMSLCYPSREDVPARFFEGLAMRTLVLSKRLPDLEKLGFIDGEDYVGFDTPDEATDLAVYYKNNPKELNRIAWNGWKKVKEHTYYSRCESIIKAVESI